MNVSTVLVENVKRPFANLSTTEVVLVVPLKGRLLIRLMQEPQ